MSAERKQARNIYCDIFTERYELQYGMPYQATAADFVHLHKLTTNSGKLSERLTVDVWKRGVDNYFKSDLGTHSLKHLCPNFVAFWKSPQDRYGKPREQASQVGAGNPSQACYATWHQKFLYATFKVTQEKRGLFDAIDELYQQVADGLDEVEAYKRLKEIADS